jgi:hypothetical protein
MIFMPVSQDKAANAVFVVLKIRDIRYDKVNAQHVFFRKSQACIDHQDVSVVFDYSHILAYFTDPAQGDNG